ncbi:toxin homologue of phage lysozyme [Rosenbergiella nectarea]|uniref:Toxin homologue of phage lysozyme n=1 Tax=Rosenbergiella nectarea TaxID=988801 RepID=A0A1H9MPB5_9GAMM|nr:pesticin C-terminus-like muramidase [Rosenbergiella nectarea]SER25536.1 toxin homologue of phage lysozyme [Rosenbergiella nectarea]
MEPKQGLLTFLAEGNNVPSGIYYSRKIHWPGNSLQCDKFASGVTIGRGYDLKNRNEGEVIKDLTMSGIPLDKAKKIAQGVTKSHCLASNFVKKNKGSIEEITEIQQLRLFENTYPKYVIDSEKFYNKHKNNECVPWNELEQPLKDVLVDMKYQGRLEINMIPIFGKNSKKAVIELIHKRSKLSSDELGRKRIPYLENNIK